MLSLKKSFTEQPALPEDAQAQAHAQDDAHAHDEAQDDAQEECLREPPEREELRGRLTGTLITFTWI